MFLASNWFGSSWGREMIHVGLARQWGLLIIFFISISIYCFLLLLILHNFIFCCTHLSISLIKHLEQNNLRDTVELVMGWFVSRQVHVTLTSFWLLQPCWSNFYVQRCPKGLFMCFCVRPVTQSAFLCQRQRRFNISFMNNENVSLHAFFLTILLIFPISPFLTPG